MKKIIAILLALSVLAVTGLSAFAEVADDAQPEAFDVSEDDVIEDDDDMIEDDGMYDDADEAGEDPDEEPDDESYDDADEAPEDDDEDADDEADSEGAETAEVSAADAESSEAAEAVGLWYGEAFGMALVLNLREDGAYTLAIPVKGENRTGRWEAEGDLVILDRDKTSRVILHAEDEALIAAIDGVDLFLIRDESEPFDGATLKEDVVMADFTGPWVCALIGVDDVFVDAAGGDVSPLRLDVNGENVVIDSGDGSEPATALATYANSVMTIDLGPDTACLIRPLDNGMLRMEVNLGEGTGVMTYYFERYEPEEEALDDEADAEDDGEDDGEEDYGEPEGDAVEDDEDEETGRIRGVIESRVADRLTDAEVDAVIIDFDGENYAADVSLSWLEESAADADRTTLTKLSDDLAAYVGQRCRNVDIVDIHWTVPNLGGASASLYYMRGDDGMEDAGSDWDSEFGD